MPTQSWKSFIQANVDKIILLFILHVLLGGVVHMAHDNLDQSLLAWAREQAGIVLGALLTLVTGAVLRNAKNPTQPSNPETPTENKTENTQ